MSFVITGLSRARRIKPYITVLVLSYCDSIKLMIIYDWIWFNGSFFLFLKQTEGEIVYNFIWYLYKKCEINIYTPHNTTYLLNKFI